VSRSSSPTAAAFEAVGEAGREALTGDLRNVIERLNLAKDGTVITKGEYLEAIATKR
jgi:hypothetical protein